MKFPPFADLDKDQRTIYSGSPSDGSIVIAGPPGSGKTVVALHRALRLAKSGKPVALIMFNKVLARYTSNFPNLPSSVKIVNMHKWIDGWYKGAFGKNFPKIDHYNPDWNRIREDIRDTNSHVLKRLDWGHLIIDEGQDFPPEMYRCLHLAMRRFKSIDLLSTSITVFADENQTITESNSSIQDLIEELNVSVKDSRLWRLTKNYRNSKEIALFSRFYQLEDISSTTLPEREYGFKPTVIVDSKPSNFQNLIVDAVNNLGDVEAGVIIFSSKRDVTSYFYKIRELIENRKLSINTQAYVSGSPKSNFLADHNNLKFDSPPSITILHSQSSKGLEFDIVFLVNLESLNTYDNGEISSYKKMYVSSSRARSTLIILMGFDDKEGFPSCARLLPSPDETINEYRSVNVTPELLEKKLSEVDWLPSAIMRQREIVKSEDLVKKLLELPITEARTILRACAERKNKLHVIITLIDDALSSRNKDGIENLILDLGVQQVSSKLTS